MSQAPVTLKFTKPTVGEVAADLDKASEDILLPLSDATDENDPLDMYRNESDAHLDRAKQLVVDNYNAHRDRGKTPPITADLVHIVWFVKALGNWKAIVVSPVVRGLLYEVTYNGRRAEAYITIFKKINDVKITD
jgi:hypothetical protein